MATDKILPGSALGGVVIAKEHGSMGGGVLVIKMLDTLLITAYTFVEPIKHCT